ncbi:MAG: hypothetical protein ACI9CA_001975, partial [Natronomonas sp.]
SGSELNSALEGLLRRADANGVDVEGGWDCTDDSRHPNWDVVVTAVERRDG